MVKKSIDVISEIVTRETYVITGIPDLEASLQVLDYHKHDVGRVVQTIEVYPESMRRGGYAQKLYLAALADGDLQERPQFRSEPATWAIERLIAKGLVARVMDDHNRPTLRLASSIGDSAQDDSVG